MAYIIRFSNHPTTPPIILNPVTAYPAGTPPNLTSLNFYGKGAPLYGEGHQENMLRMLEHFASNTAPVNPVPGQIWLDTTIDVLKVWCEYPSGSTTYAWRGVSDSEIRIAYVEEYNELAELYNKIVGTATAAITCDDAFGYGQGTITVPRTAIVNQDWKDLFNKFDIIQQHTGAVISYPFTHGKTNGFIMDYTNGTLAGIATEITRWQKTVQSCNDILDYRFNISVPSTVIGVPPTGQRVRTLPWSSNIYHDALFQFSDANHARHLFNAGGKLQFYASLTLPPSPEQDEIAFQNLFAQVGQVDFAACGTTTTGGVPLGVPSTGFYDLTTDFITIFETYIYSTPGHGGYKIALRLQNADSEILARITYIAPTGGYAYGGNVRGTLSSNTAILKANGTYINNPVINYPTVTSSGTM